MQNTSRILMIRPLHFSYNAETAVNNSFQINTEDKDTRDKAVHEFDVFVNELRTAGVDVTVMDDSAEPHTPDAIFPNNWISFHESGVLCLYPMFAANRRKERKTSVIEFVKAKFNYHILKDFTHYESENRFLEGTGSMVLDRENRIAYACLSARTDLGVLEDFCRQMSYRPVVFHAKDKSGQNIYHTNVMMCVADRFVVICFDSVTDPEEKNRLMDEIHSSAKEIIRISMEQMNHFAGNMLQLENDQKQKLLIMSDAAWKSLDEVQKEKLSGYNSVLHTNLENIETNGGGSARCMIAELYM
jgi:hypothetical protein